ncbi:MAG: thioredoxin-like domain-containing protein [Planctomycetota bacterium]|nr:thioredoxin-like domain-containing protein [Planctomycetota bacterium]
MTLSLLLSVTLLVAPVHLDDADAAEAIREACSDLVTAETSGNLPAIRRSTIELLSACKNQKLEILLKAEEDAAVLRKCLLVIGTDHGLQGRQAQVTATLGSLVEKFPDSAEAKKAGVPLARASSEMGQIDAALALIRKATEQLEAGSVEIREAWMLRGDLHAARGETLDARRAWSRLLDDLERHGNDTRARRNSTVRLTLLGKKAPLLSSNTWFGGTRRTLTQMRGEVVLLDFWATWCSPCRDLMPGLDQVHQSHKDQGLNVLGVTKPYSRGWLPSKEDPKRGQGVTRMDGDAFLMHLSDFRKRFGVSYPFVLTSKTVFDYYHVGGIPMVVLIDRDGTIAWVRVGSGGEGLLEAVIERLLAKKSVPPESG